MKRFSVVHIIIAVGGLSLLLGLGLTIRSFTTHGELGQRLLAKKVFHTQLATIGHDWQRAQTVKQTYEALSLPDEIPLQSLLDECFTNRVITPLPYTSVTPLPGWLEWQTSVTIDDIAVSALDPFLQRLSEQTPPWLVTRFDATAAGPSNGLVRISLGLSSLRRDSWPAPDASLTEVGAH